MKKIIIKILHISAVLTSFSPLFAQSDDTEIYLGSSNNQTRSLANIVFIMDTSGSMNGNVDGKTRLETVQEVANEVISESAADSDKDFNIALMSFNGNHGAVVDMPMTRLENATTDFKSIMDDYTAGGNTPITESLHEALLYLKGETPLYGSSSVSASKENGKYKSPITDECQTNHIVLFSDGVPTEDIDSNTTILEEFEALPDDNTRKVALLADTSTEQCAELYGQYFQKGQNYPATFVQGGITYTYSFTYQYNSNWQYYTYSGIGGNGACAEELALLAQTTDLAPSVDLPGMQNAIIHTVGGFAGNDALTKLKNIARYGTPLDDLGAEQVKILDSETVPKNYYAASNASELKNQLTELFGEIIKNDSTFTAPAVSVNSYNKLQHNDELYYSVFSPEKNANWKGNLKRYRLAGNVIYDYNGANAVDDTTGFFNDTSHSFWTIGDADGKAVDEGGMASRLRLPSELATKDGRMVTTFLSGNSKSLTDSSNRIHPDNSNLTNLMFDAQDDDERENIIKWASGIDVNNEDEGTVSNGSTDEFEDARPFMEDPLHSQPVIVNYTADDSVVFIGTNSGYLHAFSPKLDSAAGTTPVEQPKELFSFIPEELLTNIKPYYNGSSGKEYGLDGPISYYHNDLNKNGVLLDSNNNVEKRTINSVAVSEYMHLYTAMRRGGRNYYALDVTTPSEPKFLWQITGGTGNFQKLGQTWSKMIPAKVKWDGEEKNVLFFGGGYDRDKEDCLGSGTSLNCSDGPTTRTAMTMGNAIFMVDALTGAYLWSASNDSSAELTLSEMTSSIVSDLNIIDTDLDGLADLIYSSDTGGRLWRIDIDNEPATGDNMVAYGGLIADMNGGGSNNIQFYNTVDVAYINDENSAADPHFQLSIGSGYRAHPLNAATKNRFYIINDFNVTTKPTDANKDTFYQTVLESDLIDAEVNSAVVSATNPKGIYYKLPYAGEKVLARSTTANNIISFTTYRPNTGLSSTTCSPNVGFAYIYTLTPSYGDGTTTNDTVTITSTKLEQTGIPPEPVLLFSPDPDPDPNADPDADDDSNSKASCAGTPIIVVGAEIVDSGLDCYSRMKKTYWKMN